MGLFKIKKEIIKKKKKQFTYKQVIFTFSFIWCVKF